MGGRAQAKGTPGRRRRESKGGSQPTGEGRARAGTKRLAHPPVRSRNLLTSEKPSLAALPQGKEREREEARKPGAGSPAVPTEVHANTGYAAAPATHRKRPVNLKREEEKKTLCVSAVALCLRLVLGHSQRLDGPGGDVPRARARKLHPHLLRWGGWTTGSRNRK